MDKCYEKLESLCHDKEILKAAGLINEPPIITVDSSLPEIKNGEAILLLTGCFAPIHKGHIEALEISKCKLVEKGINVGLGLLGLCHDEYVKSKTDSYQLNTRLDLIKEITKNHTWIKPYTWEAMQNGAMNFTSVIESIKQKADNPVVFVYGSDNYNFRLAFLNNDLNICIKREIEEKDPRYLQNIKTNTIYIESVEYKSLSSSKIRIMEK